MASLKSWSLSFAKVFFFNLRGELQIMGLDEMNI